MKNFETTETINKRLSAATSHRQTNSFFVGGISSSSEDPFSEPISTAHPHSNSDITSPFLQHHLQQGEGIFRGLSSWQIQETTNKYSNKEDAARSKTGLTQDIVHIHPGELGTISPKQKKVLAGFILLGC